MALTRVRSAFIRWGRAVQRRAVEDLSALFRARAKADPLVAMSEDEFDATWDDHAALLRTWIDGLERTMAQAEARRRIFENPLPSFEERREIAETWDAVLDYLTALDQLRRNYRAFPAISPVKNPRRHVRAFAVAFGAFVAQYRNGLRWLDLTRGNPAADTIYNEPQPDIDLPQGAYARLKNTVLELVGTAKVGAGAEYFGWIKPLLRAAHTAWLADYLDGALGDIKVRLKVGDFARNGLQILKSGGFALWFPLQKRVALFMGRHRLKEKPRRAIAPHQIASLAARLRPGDILVERRNWNLSNIGLPGFWPHAALFVGTPPQARAEFGEEWWRRLRGRFPDRVDEWQKDHADGEPRSVIEALAPGVIYNSLLTSASADHVGAMRPNLPAGDRAVAVERAVFYLGRPYDYNFDFLTDSELVCSELVYKCYQPGEGQTGVHFEMVPIAGRLTLPPNRMVAKLDKEFDAKDRALDFVAFLDAREALGMAMEGTAAEFRSSHRRPKWDWKIQ